jgi:hypothetical protein
MINNLRVERELRIQEKGNLIVKDEAFARKSQIAGIFQNCRIAGNWTKLQEIPAITGEMGALF